MLARRSVLLGAVGLVGMFSVGVSVGARLSHHEVANAQAAATACSNALLSGSYGVNFTGTSQALGKFASVSLWQFDGYGNVAASETYSSDSGAGSRSIIGTYTVNPDCTFALMFASELVRQHDVTGLCVALSGGSEFYCMDNESGWVATGTGKKV